ncbi:choline/glycine/proline betaine transport protein [Desulfocicer vacuolatum DSM 3385]|uniref:Choline/glycine/proline betaine transport protein n=1 Tax=Desulfocicer vacuolatum DSM 3385 TaxID=1121400 RepID=A0A1W2BRQ5_9BACT|nr:BCCT family transporter [Desulfocicer vacuolatum]SMC75238.1 choline/glycine/proline betaine transport protein [Desulfocicer vacuolatum DSM 3385]
MVKNGSGKLTKKHPLGLKINPPIFWISSIIIIGSMIIEIVCDQTIAHVFSYLRLWVCEYTGWFFVLVVNVILFYIIYLFFSRYGKLKLGGRESKPEFNFFEWFSMIFCAGIGIGLVFFGTAEPLFHYINPPPMGVTAKSVEAANLAMALTFFHWGLHGWALYCLVGLGLGFFAFSKKLPLTVSSVFYPIIGKKIYGPMGKAIDIFACVATLFGLATSLAMAVSQINGGVNYILGTPITPTVQIALVIIITACVIISVIGGVYSGIKRLSIITIVLAFFLMAFVFITGPTAFILNAIPQNLGNYFNRFWEISLFTETFAGSHWQNSWTIFYWAWWITWAPFAGMFIARISKGRTIKEFIFGVLLAPTLLAFLWFTVFGTSALYMEMFLDAGLSRVMDKEISTVIFTFFQNLRLSGITSITGIILAALFFITSSNSATLVLSIMTAGGKTNPPNAQRIFWASIQGLVAIALMLHGGLECLQSATLVAGLPLTVILLAMLFSLKKGLREEYGQQPLG